MDEIEVAINSLKELFTTRLDTITSSIKSIECKLDTLEENRSKDHDLLIKLEAKIEANVLDLKSHETRESQYGLRIDNRLDALEGKYDDLKSIVVKYTSIAGVIIFALTNWGSKLLDLLR